jgi:hypothetical protein
MGITGTGRYWSSNFDANSLFGASAWGLNLSTNVLNNVGSSGVALGFVIRCVKENPTTAPNISAKNNRTIIAFYNILGQKLPQAPQSGIYIVAFDNGSTEKRIR